MTSRSAALGAAAAAVLIVLCGAAAARYPASEEVATILANRPVAVFDPGRDWGGALDGHGFGDIGAIYTAGNVAAMRSAGLGPVSYRLRTELGVETWHWNPDGRWSDPRNRQGYWTSSSRAAAPITVSFGYRLPRRGRTIDDANNDGYSRIDDGDTASFWKTDPYLDPRYTGDPDRYHPQWFSVDLGAPVPVQVIRLLWGAPYPRRYEVDYWRGDSSQLIDDNPDGEWRRFPGGDVTTGEGGTVELRLAPTPVRTRFIRVVMSASSHTAAGGNGDPRDSLGYALREIYAGDLDAGGVFHDRVRHDTVASRQSVVLVSSTDPWHRAVDRDTSTAQPGFDLVIRSGLTNHLPVLVPTGLLFDTPDNAAAEVRFLRSRGYPLEGIELGEEPDGQRVTPEDYGALYLQFAAAMHAADPACATGRTQLAEPARRSVDALARPRGAGHAATAGSDGFSTTSMPIIARRISGSFRSSGIRSTTSATIPPPTSRRRPACWSAAWRGCARPALPDSIPRIMTEYGYSAHISPAEVTLPSALFDAELVANFFAHGGARRTTSATSRRTSAHEPDCARWGNLVMFLADSNGQAA